MIDEAMKIVEPLIRRILAAGYKIAVYEGEDWALEQPSDNYDTIRAALAWTDSDMLYIYSDRPGIVGWICLIYCNGEDVISDYTDNPIINALVNGITNTVLTVDGRYWLVREAVSAAAALSCIHHAMAIGSIGQKDMRADIATDGTRNTVTLADVIELVERKSS